MFIFWQSALQAAVIIAAGLCVYWPALRGDWLWDDNILVTLNANLQCADPTTG